MPTKQSWYRVFKHMDLDGSGTTPLISRLCIAYISPISPLWTSTARIRSPLYLLTSRLHLLFISPMDLDGSGKITFSLTLLLALVPTRSPTPYALRVTPSFNPTPKPNPNQVRSHSASCYPLFAASSRSPPRPFQTKRSVGCGRHWTRTAPVS